MGALRLAGFDRYTGPSASVDTVRHFMERAFGETLYRRANVASIVKSDLIMVYIDAPFTEEVRDEMDQMFLLSRYYWRRGVLNVVFCETRQEYERLAMLLEGVASPAELRHLYKVRALSGEVAHPSYIQLGSIEIERPEDFDYLAGCGVEEERQVMAVYLLGTIAHEVMHRLRKLLPQETFAAYPEIVAQESNADLRPRFVTDYVLRHAIVYQNSEKTIIEEDLCEATRVYFSNPTYLEQNYPRRYGFLRTAFPRFMAGAAVEIVKQYDPIPKLQVKERKTSRRKPRRPIE